MAADAEGIVHKTTAQDVDALFFSLYSEWLMSQPEAQITNGSKLIGRIEECWHIKEFLNQLPTQFEAQIRKHLEEL